MPDPTPDVPSEPVRIPAERYFALAREGAFGESDRVELLEGVIVCVPPMSPRHGWAITAASAALQPLVGRRASLRVQCPLVLGTFSVPEPDLAVVPGTASDWGDRHPTTALLVVEASSRSLPQDRLTKSAIYARAGIPEYWILDPAARRLEVRRDPDAAQGRYRTLLGYEIAEDVEPVFAPVRTVPVRDLLPQPGPAPTA